MKHHTKPKKFLSIALAVLLLLSLYTPLALADDTPITFADLQTWIANEPAGAQALFPNLDFYPPSNPLPTGDDVGNVSLGISVATTPDVDDDGPETYCYEDLELRVSFGTAAPYLDLDAMLVALGASTSVGGTAFNVSLDDSDPDNPYISFKAPRTSEIYVGTLEFPLLLKNGITPNLTNLPLRAEWFYPDSDDSHIMKSLYYADITPALQAGAQLEWGSAATGTTTQPAGGFVIPNINNQDFCPDSGPFVWTVNVQDKIIVKPNSNHQFADTFEIDNTLSFGEGITANLSDIIVTWDDGTQIPATITPNGNSFNIRFSYTPDKADPILNPANFSYKVSLASVHLGTSLPIDDLTRNVTLDASASKVSGVNSESVFVAVAGNQSTYTLKRIKPDESFDPDLAGSLHVNKVMKGHASDYEFEDTDEAVFAIEDIGFGDNNAFTVDNFTITDMAFDSKLVPKIVKLGTYTGGYKPRELLLTINNKIYTYDVSALPANATVDLTAVLSDLNLKDSDGYNPPGGTALKQITKMTLNFGTITQTPGAKFSASVAPQFIFTVTVKEPYNGGTANNYAYMEFLYAKPNHSDVTYSMRDSETIKLRENTIPFIDLNKNAQMSTDAFDPANPGDYTDFKPFDDGEEEPNRYYKYTITLRNYGPPTEGDRVLLDPWIRDTLPTQYLDMTKFKVISVTYPPNPPSNITIALTADDYTSKTDSVSPAKSAILWDFKGTLNPSETITIEYVVKMKSKQQLIADGWTEGDSLEVNNTVESNGYTDIAGVNVRPRYPRPNITLRLNVDINGFTTPPADPSTSKYTLTVHNDENLFDGSIDVDRVRAAAQLPNGFTLKTGSLDDAALKALFSVTHGKIVNSVFTATGAINDILAASTNTYVPDSGYSESGSVRYIYQDYTNTPIYTITLYEKSAGVYDHFVFDMEKNNILPTTSTLGGDNGDALTIVFNANIAPAYSDFTEGYKTSFEADANVYMWSEAPNNPQWFSKWGVTAAGDEISWNTATTNVRWKGGNSKKITDDNLDNDDATTDTVQASVARSGVLGRPIIGISKRVSSANATYSPNVGYNVIEYTVRLSNYSTTPFTPDIPSIVDLLPPGQTYVAGSNSVTGYSGSAGINPVVTYDTANSTPSKPVFTIAADDWTNFKGTDGTTFTPGFIEFKFRANITANGGDNLVNTSDDFDSAFTGNYAPTAVTTNNTAFLFSNAEISGNEAYAYNGNNTPIALSDSESSAGYTFGNSGDDSFTAARIIRGTAPVTYSRPRIAPALVKSIVDEPTTKKKGVDLNWRLTLSNIAAYSNTTIIGDGAYIIDVIPAALDYSPGSAMLGATQREPTIFASGSLGGDYVDSGLGAFSGNITDKTVKIMVWKLREGDNVGRGSSLALTYKTKIDIDESNPDDVYGSYINTAYFLPTALQHAIFTNYTGADLSGTTSPEKVGTYIDNLRDTELLAKIAKYAKDDLESAIPGSDNETFRDAMKATCDVDIWGDINLTDWKSVTNKDGGDPGLSNADTTAGEKNYTTITAGDDFTYTLNVNNGSGSENLNAFTYQNIVLIDKLPFIGDTGIISSAPRGTEWVPTLKTDSGDTLIAVKVVSKSGSRTLTSADYTILYQTTNRPYTDYDWGIGTANPAVDNTWKTWAAVSAGDTVYGFRIVFNSTPEATLKSQERLVIDVPMSSPNPLTFAEVEQPDKFTAWNSFAFRVSITNQLVGSKPTFEFKNLETAKVGARIRDTHIGSLTIEKHVFNAGNNDITLTMPPRTFNIRVTGPNGYSEERVLNSANGYSVTLNGLYLGKYNITELTDHTGAPASDSYVVTMKNRNTGLMLPSNGDIWLV